MVYCRRGGTRTVFEVSQIEAVDRICLGMNIRNANAFIRYPCGNWIRISCRDPRSDDALGHSSTHVCLTSPFPVYCAPCHGSAFVCLRPNAALRRLAFSCSMGNDQSCESVVRNRLCRSRTCVSGFRRTRHARQLTSGSRKLAAGMHAPQHLATQCKHAGRIYQIRIECCGRRRSF